jgi:hypothetical protein
VPLQSVDELAQEPQLGRALESGQALELELELKPAHMPGRALGLELPEPRPVQVLGRALEQVLRQLQLAMPEQELVMVLEKELLEWQAQGQALCSREWLEQGQLRQVMLGQALESEPVHVQALEQQVLRQLRQAMMEQGLGLGPSLPVRIQLETREKMQPRAPP